MATKMASSMPGDEMLPEYDLDELKNPVRGKYYARAMAGTSVVLLDPDVAEAFPDSKLVSDARRVLGNVATPKVRRGLRTRQQGADEPDAAASPS